MFSIRQVTTYVGRYPAFVTNISDLQIGQTATGTYLFSATQLGAGLASFRLTAADEPMRIMATQAYPPSAGYLDAPEVALLPWGNGLAVFGTAVGAAWTDGFVLASGGLLNGPVSPSGSALPTTVTHLGAFEIGGSTLLYTTRNGSTLLETWRIGADGSVSSISRAQLPVGPAVQGVEISDVEIATLGDRTFILTTSALGNYVAAQLVNADGSLGQIQYVSVALGYGINGPAEIETVRVAGITYLLVGSTQSSSLTVLRLDYNGNLSHADHILDELGTRFSRITALETVEVGGRSYIIVGGADDGISVFTIQPDGHLLHLATLSDTADRTLQDVSAISAIAMNGQVALFVSSRTERGITQFTFDPGQLGETRILPAGQYTGTSGSDMLQAGQGTTRILGGAGDDILIAGPDPVQLTGGDGADLFVASRINGKITITDYEQGVDRLDLANLGMIRSTLQLTFRRESFGITITFGDTQIEVRTRDGRGLNANAFNNSMFPIAHYEVSGMRTILIGTAGADNMTAGRYGSNVLGYAERDLLNGQGGDDRLYGGDDNDTIQGAAGDDSLQGDDGNDLLRGGDGNDSVLGGDQDDTLYGGVGNDRLLGQAGNDRTYGEDGNDTIVDSLGNNSIFGGNGHDSIAGGTGSDSLDGGAGNDTLHGGAGSDRLSGGTGDDRLNGNDGHDRMSGGSGHDNLNGGSGNDTLAGDDGNDWIWGDIGNDSINGGMGHDSVNAGDGNDTVRGATGHDLLAGGDDNDLIYGDDGNDTLSGGLGHDRMVGGTGNDRMLGDAGNDSLSGEIGNDTLLGGAGNDSIRSGPGNHLIQGDDGNDLIVADSGNDSILGGTGNDSIQGMGGFDTIDGGAGNDTIRSGAAMVTGGRNQLSGGTGNDLIVGGRDIDWIRGGTGSDRMTGGAGADLFLFRAAEDFDRSNDVITDFTRGADHLDLRGMDLDFIGRAEFSAAGQVRLTTGGALGLTVEIDLNGDRVSDLRIGLGNVADLTAGDFLL
ncbi:calcium-binding protein [Paracoccus litorisediminis]|uniref:Calcium-binding protein n=1 Tax=Paracoccus litorisediminis TaxID=2006130 RepID=A0A844HFV7_9RHOB|nr:calcium-binding protein [Paracoccus litorisediminis]MTH58723.1 calcium-binding protein [Paracoccus litorisediminis]